MVFAKGGVFSCKFCGQPLLVHSNFSAIRICQDCGQQHLKYEGDERQLLPVPEDMSLLRIGVKGEVQEGAFEIIGRYRLTAADSYFNLWCMHIADGDILNFIIESPGCLFYAHQVKPEKNTVAVIAGLDIDESADLKDIGRYRLLYRPKPLTEDMEGELPEMPVSARSYSFYELTNKDDSILILAKYKANIFGWIGTLMQPNEFKFQNLRKLPVEFEA